MSSIFGFGITGLWAAAVIGWVLNIYKLIVAVQAAAILAAMDPFTILRAVGVFLAPLGAIIGWF
jgi:hypothetical protein